MKKTKVGNIDIEIYPEEKMMVHSYGIGGYDVVVDGKKYKIPGFNGHIEKTYTISTETSGNLDEFYSKSIIKEPGRARKIYNKLRRFLKWGVILLYFSVY